MRCSVVLEKSDAPWMVKGQCSNLLDQNLELLVGSGAWKGVFMVGHQISLEHLNCICDSVYKLVIRCQSQTSCHCTDFRPTNSGISYSNTMCHNIQETDDPTNIFFKLFVATLKFFDYQFSSLLLMAEGGILHWWLTFQESDSRWS